MKSSRTNHQPWMLTMLVLALSWASAEEVNLTSGYLANKIDGISQFTLQGELDGKAKLTLDPNSCSLNAWGDTQMCTLIAPNTKDVELVRQRLEDPLGLGRRIYQINNAGLSKPIKLVVGKGSARLVFGADNGEYTQIPMTMVASKEETSDAWELSVGKYRATQRQGKVTIYASGEHPTAGFETELKQLRFESIHHSLSCDKRSRAALPPK